MNNDEPTGIVMLDEPEPSLYGEVAEGAFLMACLIISSCGIGFVVGRYFL